MLCRGPEAQDEVMAASLHTRPIGRGTVRVGWVFLLCAHGICKGALRHADAALCAAERGFLGHVRRYVSLLRVLVEPLSTGRLQPHNP